jgi:hypothetical protein
VIVATAYTQNMMSPEMMSMMKNMDFSQDKVNQQFQELGLKPEDVITKVGGWGVRGEG